VQNTGGGARDSGDQRINYKKCSVEYFFISGGGGCGAQTFPMLCGQLTITGRLKVGFLLGAGDEQVAYERYPTAICRAAEKDFCSLQMHE
jgi:hypothetical protein